MEPIFELRIDLPPAGSRTLLRDLHRQLRTAILDGRLQPGLRLPATRVLAAMLGISRNTVLAAYDLLLSEGYLAGRPGAGTFVADALPRQLSRETPADTTAARRHLSAAWRKPQGTPAAPPGRHFRYDFRLGNPDIAGFPFEVWRRLSARALRTLTRGAAGYAEPQGQPHLRQAIAAHVSFTRAVSCAAADVVVTAGAQQAFDLLARILVTPGRTIAAMEDPGYPPLRMALAAAGARVVPIPVDGEGMAIDRLPDTADIVCVTPSHQFPLGVVMSSARRAALIEFADVNDAIVIEDDYDSEFRFGGRPLDALQTLDRSDSVFYVGTFSKSLFPALRLGFVVAPSWARPALVAAKHTADWHSPVVAQETLAAFIVEGHLTRHIRRMRKIYRQRRTVLLDALARHCGRWLDPLPSEAGLHLSARLVGPVRAEAIVARAAEREVAIEPLDRYAIAGRVQQGLTFGFGACRTHDIDEAVARLARVLSLERGGPPR